MSATEQRFGISGLMSGSMGSLMGPVQKAYKWWTGTLIDSLPPKYRHCCRLKRRLISVRLESQGAALLLLEPIADDAETEEVPLSGPGDLATAVSMLKPSGSSQFEVAIEVGADAVLHRTVKWPLETESNLDTALEYQLGKLIPFARDDVFFGYRVTDRDRKEQKVTFDIVAVPRSVVSPWLDALQDDRTLGPYLNAIWAEPTGRALNLLPGADRRLDNGGGAAKRGLVAGGIVLLLAIAIGLGFIKQSRELALLDEAVASARVKAENVRSDEQDLDYKVELLVLLAEIDRKLPQHDAVLAELARLVPDTTYLQRLTINGTQMDIIGQAESSVALVDLLSESSLFEDFQFVSRVTRDSRTGKERFQLQVRIKAPS